MSKPLIYATLVAASILTGVLATSAQAAPAGPATIGQMTQPAPSMSPSPEPTGSSKPS
jgi:hypothetical protein